MSYYSGDTTADVMIVVLPPVDVVPNGTVVTPLVMSRAVIVQLMYSGDAVLDATIIYIVQACTIHLHMSYKSRLGRSRIPFL